MSLVLARTIVSFLFPGGALALVAYFAVRIPELAVWLPAIVRIYPYVVIVVAFFVGWRFNKSRLLFAILVLSLSEFFLGRFDASTEYGPVVYDAVSLLFPLNFLFLTLASERGFLTFHGVLRLSLIVVQPLAIAFLYYCYYPAIAEYLGYEFIHFLSFPALPFSQSALLAFGCAALLMAFRFLRNREAMDHGFFWALVMVFVALFFQPGVQMDFYFATAVVILVVSVIEAAHSMAFRDELTGLPARRALNEALLKLHGRYAVAMVDIDFFKKFNDRYGHDVGDQVLRMVAARLSKVTGGGKPFRYGGEEFTVLFPGRSAEESLPHLEDLRKAVAAAGFNIRSRNRPRTKPRKKRVARGYHKKVSVTISVGVSEKRDGQNLPQEVVKAADKALYRAKNTGRNKVST